MDQRVALDKINQALTLLGQVRHANIPSLISLNESIVAIENAFNTIINDNDFNIRMHLTFISNFKGDHESITRLLSCLIDINERLEHQSVPSDDALLCQTAVKEAKRLIKRFSSCSQENRDRYNITDEHVIQLNKFVQRVTDNQ